MPSREARWKRHELWALFFYPQVGLQGFSCPGSLAEFGDISLTRLTLVVQGMSSPSLLLRHHPWLSGWADPGIPTVAGLSALLPTCLSRESPNSGVPFGWSILYQSGNIFPASHLWAHHLLALSWTFNVLSTQSQLPLHPNTPWNFTPLCPTVSLSPKMLLSINFIAIINQG